MREKGCGGRKTTGLSRTTHQPGATLTPPHRTGTSRQRPEGSRTQKPCHETEGLNPTAQQDRTRMQNSCMNRGLIPPNWGVELLVHHQERLCQFVAFVFNHKLDTHRPWICRTQQNLQALSLTPALSRWARGRRQAAQVFREFGNVQPRLIQRNLSDYRVTANQVSVTWQTARMLAAECR